MQDIDYTQSVLAAALNFVLSPLMSKGEYMEHIFKMDNFYPAIELGFTDILGQMTANQVHKMDNKYLFSSKNDDIAMVSTGIYYSLTRRLFNHDTHYLNNIVKGTLIDAASIVLTEPDMLILPSVSIRRNESKTKKISNTTTPSYNILSTNANPLVSKDLPKSGTTLKPSLPKRALIGVNSAIENAVRI
jgi:hypothetical protein